MPCEVLIRATTHADAPVVARYKGDPQEVRDDAVLLTHPWGLREGLPEFVILHITDADAAQIQTYMDAVVNTFKYVIQAENASGWRIHVSVNPKITTLYGVDKGVRNDIRDYLIDQWGGVVFDYDNVNHNYAVMDFPKPLMHDGLEHTLLDLKSDVHDKFVDTVSRRRYLFSETDIDQVIGLGGKVDQTLAQVKAKVIDRLD